MTADFERLRELQQVRLRLLAGNQRPAVCVRNDSRGIVPVARCWNPSRPSRRN